MTNPTAQAHLIEEHGLHKFLPGVKPDGAPKGAHYPCRVCGTSRKNSIHREGGLTGNTDLLAVADEKTVCVKCPTCNGKGTVALDIDDVQRLVLKARAK